MEKQYIYPIQEILDEWARNYSSTELREPSDFIAIQQELGLQLRVLKVKVVEKGIERGDRRKISDVFEGIDSVSVIKRDLNTTPFHELARGWPFYNALSMWMGEFTEGRFGEKLFDKWLEQAKFLRDLALKYINDEL